MNNPNNSNRVVINLDDGLDDLDDDDITLPSLPVQSVPIIDETERAALQRDNTANPDVSNNQAAENIALATPIVMTEEHNVPKGASESFSSAKETGTTSKPSTATTIPAMP
ncbi:MAG: signal recognition particle-docking protein FtsY, partial [Psychrobacter sp.]